MVKIIRNEIINDSIANTTEFNCKNIIDASKLLEDLYKIDLGRYQYYLDVNSNYIYNCDGTYYYGIEYNFVICKRDICYELNCRIVNAKENCLKNVFRI
jgi:hypothetical protein